ncbi:hypothetical protein ACHAPT_007051 [Fusarium lateritium]
MANAHGVPLHTHDYALNEDMFAEDIDRGVDLRDRTRRQRAVQKVTRAFNRAKRYMSPYNIAMLFHYLRSMDWVCGETRIERYPEVEIFYLQQPPESWRMHYYGAFFVLQATCHRSEELRRVHRALVHHWDSPYHQDRPFYPDVDRRNRQPSPDAPRAWSTDSKEPADRPRRPVLEQDNFRRPNYQAPNPRRAHDEDATRPLRADQAAPPPYHLDQPAGDPPRGPHPVGQPINAAHQPPNPPRANQAVPPPYHLDQPARGPPQGPHLIDQPIDAAHQPADAVHQPANPLRADQAALPPQHFDQPAGGPPPGPHIINQLAAPGPHINNQLAGGPPPGLQIVNQPLDAARQPADAAHQPANPLLDPTLPVIERIAAQAIQDTNTAIQFSNASLFHVARSELLSINILNYLRQVTHNAVAVGGYQEGVIPVAELVEGHNREARAGLQLAVGSAQRALQAVQGMMHLLATRGLGNQALFRQL